MKANEIDNRWQVYEAQHSKAEKSFSLVDYRTANALCRYAVTNWKACFTEDEIIEYSRDILSDKEIISTYMAYLAEEIDEARENHRYDDEAIRLYNQAKAILKRMTA